MTTVASITPPRLAAIGKKVSVMTGMTPVCRRPNATTLTVTLTCTRDVTCLTIPVPTFLVLTENVTSTSRHLTTAVRVDYLTVSSILEHATTSPTVRTHCSSPTTASATKIRPI